MKKYILFDNDGVLVDTEYWYFMSTKRALSKLGININKKLYLTNMSKGISIWQQAKDLGIDKTVISQKREIRNRYYQEYLQKENIEINGVEEVLSKLSKKYRMAVITTSKRNDFELIHEKRRIIDYMDFVLTVEDYDNAKPFPDPYLAGLKRFGALKEETLIVEDSERGLMSAVNAGIDCVIVHNEFMETNDFSKATHRIKSLNELLILLKE
ncbi:MAG TPA: HAD-IA family hydrolase [Victivallales bacterium]|nr:HAD-IA family hydrolase [Victivallales bacterium]